MNSPQPQYHRELSRVFGIQLGVEIDILNLGTSSTGTHKDALAERAFKATSDLRERTLIALSSGNYGRALSHLAVSEGRKTIVALTGESLIKEGEITNDFCQVVNVKDLQNAIKSNDLSGPRLVDAYVKLAGGENQNLVTVSDIPDILKLEGKRNGRDYTPTYTVDTKNYAAVICPNGSGQLLHDLALGGCTDNSKGANSEGVKPYHLPFKSRTKTAFIGISQLTHPAILGSGKIFLAAAPSSVADKLVTPHDRVFRSLSGITMRKLSIDQIHRLGATEAELIEAYAISKEFELDCEVSGAAGLVALIKSFRERTGLSLSGGKKGEAKERILIVSTGRGRKAPTRTSESSVQ